MKNSDGAYLENKSIPKVSVIMSVFMTDNNYLKEAIDSIIRQTFDEWEFIIVDDGCDLETKKLLNSYKDTRIRKVINDENVGLTKSLNRAIKLAKGEYIARMDADDVSEPTRLEKSLGYLQEHPNVNILGTYSRYGRRIEKSYGSISHEARRALFLIDNAGPVHSSVIIRKSFLDDNNLLYDEQFRKAQDYELWSRCIELTDIFIYPECLQIYRIHDKQISSASHEEQDECATRVRARLLADLDDTMTNSEIMSFVQSRKKATIPFETYKKMVKQFMDSNLSKQKYDTMWLDYVMNWYLLKFIKNNMSGVTLLVELIRTLFDKQFINYIKGSVCIMISKTV